MCQTIPDSVCFVNKYLQKVKQNVFVHSTAKVKEWNGDKLLPFSPDVKNIITNSRDPEELQYYWDQWRHATGERMGDQYRQYIDLYNEAATLNGFR